MDAAIVAATFIFTHLLGRRLGLPGPGTWATLCAFGMASWRLHDAGMQWSDLGLRSPTNWRIALAWVVALYIAAGVTKLAIIDPIAKFMSWPPLNLSRFSKLPGNTVLFIAGFCLVWLQAAFGEELVFRGFLMNRLEALLGDGSGATAMAVTGQAVFFGVAHWYLGPRGVLTAGALGLILGMVYFCDGRNLVPLIVAHGLVDSLSLMAIYARLVPLS